VFDNMDSSMQDTLNALAEDLKDPTKLAELQHSLDYLEELSDKLKDLSIDDLPDIDMDMLSKVMDKMKEVSKGMKIALVGMASALGLVGLGGIGAAAQAGTVNKSAQAVTDGKVKVKSPKKMMILSLLAATIAIGSSVAMFVFLFVEKGGF